METTRSARSKALLLCQRALKATSARCHSGPEQRARQSRRRPALIVTEHQRTSKATRSATKKGNKYRDRGRRRLARKARQHVHSARTGRRTSPKFCRQQECKSFRVMRTWLRDELFFLRGPRRTPFVYSWPADCFERIRLPICSKYGRDWAVNQSQLLCQTFLV